MDEDNLQRRIDELELIQSMFPNEISFERTSSTGNPRNSNSFEIVLDCSVKLCFTLPEQYPSTAKPEVHLDFTGDVGNHDRKALREGLNTILEELQVGQECLDEVITAFQASLARTLSAASFTVDDAESKVVENSEKDPPIKAVLIWTHHLLSSAKRKFIVSRSSELSLSGISKPGHPGVIIIEGSTEHVDTFVQELKSLKWQAIAVKAELQFPTPEALSLGDRALHVTEDSWSPSRKGVAEVATMADLTARLRGTKLESWFLDSIGIRRANDGRNKRS